MSFTHKIIQELRYLDSNESVQLKQTIETTEIAGAENNLDEEFTDASEGLTAYTLDISQLKSFCMWCTGGSITVETNNSVTPDDTFALTVGGEPVVYASTAPFSPPNPFSSDVTALYITNSGTGTLHIRALIDPTV